MKLHMPDIKLVVGSLLKWVQTGMSSALKTWKTPKNPPVSNYRDRLNQS